MRYQWIIALTVGLMALALATLAQAQIASPTPSPSSTATSPAPSPTPPAPSLTVSLPPLEVTPTDLGVPNPSGWQFFKRKFVRFFTRDEVKRAKLNLELANLTLLRAEQLAAAGDTDRAVQSLTSYQQQLSAISQTVGNLFTRLPTDPAVTSLADRLATDNLLQGELLDGLQTTQAAGEFNEKILIARLEVTKKLVDLLTKEDLPPEELAEKLAKLEAKLTTKETQADRQYLRRLQRLAEIDDATDDSDLEEGLEQGAKDAVRRAATELTPDQLGTVVRSIPGDLWKHIAVLQAVLDQVPAAARPALEEVIADQLEDVAERAREMTDEALEQELEDAEDKDVLEAQEQLTKKLQEKLKDDQKRAEKLKKKLEKLHEKLREETEDEGNPADERRGAVTPTPSSTGTTHTPTPTTTRDDDKENTDRSTTSPSPSPTANPTATSTPTSSPTQNKLEMEVDIQNFAFSKTLALEKGRKTKIRVHNRDSVSHTLTISSLGVSTGTIKPGSDEDIEFTPPTTGSFKVTCDFHPSMSGSVQVN